jgi:glycosyltransferase involved in cell wall biosynthesis
LKLSIITVSRNNVVGLKKTVASVLSQSERTLFEYIVIDGGSHDGSKALLEDSVGIDFWISESDRGIYDAMNKGILRAHGEYLLFINSGDRLFEANTIREVMPYLDGTQIVYGDLKLEEGPRLRDGFMPEVIDLRQLMQDTLWHPVSFIRSELFSLHGLYDTTYRICADYEFFFNVIIDKKVSQHHVSEFIAIFELTGVSSTPANQIVVREEKRRAQLAWLSKREIDRFWRHERRRQALRRGRRFLSRWFQHSAGPTE